MAVNIGDHKTTGNILATGAFTVAPADAAHAGETDPFGMATGRKVGSVIISAFDLLLGMLSSVMMLEGAIPLLSYAIPGWRSL